MSIRAKFEVTRVSELGYGGSRQEIQRPAAAQEGDSEYVMRFESTGIPVREITMSAVYGGSEENKSFSEATPTGTITFLLTNPAAAEHFKPGQAYYVDFTPAK